MLLLAGGVASVALSHMAVGPEVLGLASTAVRDNKYMSLERRISMMEGTNVSAKFRDMRVRFGVVKDDEAVGEILGVGYQKNVVTVRDALRMRGD